MQKLQICSSMSLITIFYDLNFAVFYILLMRDTELTFCVHSLKFVVYVEEDTCNVILLYY